MQLTAYTIGTPVWNGRHHTTYRARRLADDAAVMIQVPNVPDPPAWWAARARLAHDMARSLDFPGILRPLAVEPYGSGAVLVTEDFGGVCLPRMLAETRPDVGAFCRMANQMCDVMAAVHEVGVMHKDVKTSNFIIHPDTLEVRLTGFGIASRLPREESLLLGVGQLEGTLAYMAPEQTGRVNRGIDWRSDLYSLGVTLYEMLTGRVPFPGPDPLEVVYHHIATTPRPPHELNPAVPMAVSAIVMRLLTKEVEDRYQSAQGVRSDLSRCLAEWQESRTVTFFNLGAHDTSRVFRIPQKLYGRESQVEALRRAFNETLQSGAGLVLVTGSAGIGKSALVGELRQPVTRQKGYFLTGKFDQYERNVPYSAFVQAFRQMARQLLTEPADALEGWRERLARGLGSNGQVLIDVVPEMAAVLGPQPEVPVLGGDESERRFNLVMRQFVRSIASIEHPLVMFLDDLQWAGDAALKLMQELLADIEMHGLLLVGAYRDNETLDDELARLHSEATMPACRTLRLELRPLLLDDVATIVADTLRTPPHPIAELVHSRTGGNPFFITQFLQTLYKRGLVDYSAEACGWVGNMDAILTEAWTDDVVSLMVSRLQGLSPETTALLQTAACVGKTFSQKLLATVSEMPRQELNQRLAGALSEGLIVPLDGAYKYVDDGAESVYAFLHDRVQQAALATVAESDRPALHARIGRLLLAGSDADGKDRHLFEIVGHLNAALPLLTAREKLTLADLNLAAARKAGSAAANQAARDMLQAAVAMLPADAWTTCYALVFDIHVELAKALSMVNENEAMEKVAETTFLQARDLLDRTRILEVRMYSYINRIQWTRVLDIGLEALRLLGEPIPSAPHKGNVLAGLVSAEREVRSHTPDTLLALPPMTDPFKLAAMRVLRAMSSAAYFSRPNVYPMVIFRMVSLSLHHGNCGDSAYGYVGYGLVLAALLGRLDRGYRMGRVAISIVEQYKARHLQGQIHLVFNIFLRHWVDPLAQTIPTLRDSARQAMENGDAEYWSYSLFWHGCHSLYSGRNLPQLRLQLEHSLRSIHRQKQEKGLLMLHLHHLATELVGDSPAAAMDNHSEPELVERWTKARDWNSLCYAHGYQSIGRYLLGDFKGCLERMGVCERYIETLAGQSCLPVFLFYQGLAANALGQRRKAAGIRHKLARWARACPANYHHRQLLLEAEMARVAGEDRRATRLFQQSIHDAASGGFTQDEALAHELAGRHARAIGHETAARAHLAEAVVLYKRWGAQRIVGRLEKEFPHYNLGLANTAQPQPGPVPPSADPDARALLEAAQALSGEIVLEDVVKHLMRILMQAGGAQRAVLLLEVDGEVRVAGQADGEHLEILTGETSVPTVALPQAIVTFVLRSGTTVVLDNACVDNRFERDPYVTRCRLLAALCTPVVRQGSVLGAVYLENQLIQGAFTPRHVHLTHVLASQAAISIENARHFQRQQEHHAQILAERERRHEEALKARTMETRKNAIASLLAIASHDLKNPLAGIRMWCQFIPSADEAERLEVQKAIFSLCRRAESLILSYLDGVSAEFGKPFRLRLEPLNLCEVVESEIQFQLDSLPASERATTELEFVLDDAWVEGDRARLVQVVTNLLENALKYAGRMGPVEVSVQQSRGLARCTVRDHGPGLPPGVVDQNFAPFERGAEDHAGSGLGLWLSRAIMEAHGGRLGIEQGEDGGASVWFELPLIPPPVVEGGQEAECLTAAPPTV